MKPNRYRVSLAGTNKTLIHKQAKGKGELKLIQTLNIKVDSNTMMRLQNTLNDEADAAVARHEAAKAKSISSKD